MKNIKKIISLTFAALFTVFAFGCGDTQGEEAFDPTDIGTPPDYSTVSYEPYDHYAYHPLSRGRYYIDGAWVDTGKNYMDDPTYMDYYVQTGMKTMFFQAFQYQQTFIEAGVKEVWEDSSLKHYMDMAQEAGVEKAILIDWRLYLLSCENVEEHLYKVDDLQNAEWTYQEPTFEEQKAAAMQLKLTDGTFRFETKSAFYNFIASCLKEYEDHEIFDAVILRDEPSYKLFNAAGDIFEAVRAYNATKGETDKKVRVIQNLLPIYGDGSLYFDWYDETMTKEEMYKTYLNGWLDKTGESYVMFDSYPILANGIQSLHLKGLKIAADICKERGAKLMLVMQTFAMKMNGNLSIRVCQKDDLYWQANMAMGYGVDNIIYFTYFTRGGGNSTRGEFDVDGGAFLTLNGERTDIYYTMTDIMAEMKAFAPVIRNFKYNASGTFKTLPLDKPMAYDYEKSDSFEKVKSVTVESGDVVLVSELKDTTRGNYLYMVQNILDPVGGKVYDTTIDAKVEFDSQYNYVAIYYKDTVRYEKLKDHTYTTTLSAGYAEFLMPY